MRIRVQVIIESDQETTPLQSEEVAFERGTLAAKVMTVLSLVALIVGGTYGLSRVPQLLATPSAQHLSPSPSQSSPSVLPKLSPTPKISTKLVLVYKQYGESV